MAERSSFKNGDRVRHSDGREGEVTSVTDTSVIVKFDHGKSGGEYDDLWFRIYPDGLRLTIGG
jgi:FKBP-type peptidyl-prolyl cis-trans isomerase 2